MVKIKLTSFILLLAMAAMTFTGCSSSTQNPQTTKPADSNQQTNSPASLKDGTYKAEIDSYDTHGYKPALEITVSSGKITAAKYDEYKQDGTTKSQDSTYKTKMQESNGINPEEAYTRLEDKLVSKQSANIDSVSGATASSNSFKQLAAYAISQLAAKGNTTPAKIPAK